MLDASLARHGNQDIHALRGVQFLTRRDKLIFQACLLEHVRAEVKPRPEGNTEGDE